MKEKTIEKIPYLGLQKISRIKSVKYIGVTAVKVIGHKKHLLLEVYENKKESKKIPVVRIALTKKDFGTYWPEKHVWTRQQVSYYRPIWMETHTGGTLTDENILQSPEDLERIKTFCGTKLFNPSWWWEHISRYEADITSTERINRVEREHKRRQEALKDRQANTKALPEKAILYRADHVYFHDEHFLYYKKHGSRADIACSKCGGVTTARWKSSGAYEDQFERNIEEPRENSFGTCPMCGARGQYKCKGKVKGSIRKTQYLFLGQKYKDNGFVMRYIQVKKEWTLGFIAGENGNEMYNAYEKLSGVELARAYFEPGKKVQVDYNKHDPYVGKDFWDDCNLYGLSSIRINSGPILPETYDEMTGTMFQYSAMKEYTDSLMSTCNPVEYLECYMRTPQLEMLVKMHLIGVAEKLIKCQYGIIEDETATRPDEFLGIRKEKLKLLIKEKGDIGLLRVLQMEKRFMENWTDEQVQQLAETGLTYTQVALAKKYMTLQKFLNRIKKYACCDYGGCSRSVYVNPAGNRSFKKGLYFMMMYENRVTIKKFGDTPKNMSWWEFYQRMSSIFDEDAAGTRTWQNHFGGDDETQENEPTGEHTTAETPESEDDNAAVGEAGTDEVEETESGSVADNEPAPGAGEEQKDDSTDRDTDCGEDNKEPADRPEEQTGEKSLAEQIAPAQKSTETLEKEEVEDDETGENESSDAENQTAESEPETAEREQTEETEVIEAVYGTRKEYMDRLSEQGMAEYMADEYKSHRLLVTDLANIWNLRKWLSKKVDRFGKPMEDAR